MEIDGAPGSAHDVLGRGFALLAAPGGQRLAAAASQAGVALGCPVSGYRVAPDGDLVTRANVRPAKAGPDGRCSCGRTPSSRGGLPRRHDDPHAEVEEALRRLLFRQP